MASVLRETGDREGRLTRRIAAGAREAVDYLKSDRLIFAAFLFLVVLAVSAVTVDWISPYDPTAVDLGSQHLSPLTTDRSGGLHVLGTDFLGRDLLTRIVFASRVSLTVGLGTVAIAGSIGILVGLWSGLVRGRGDSLVMRIVDIQLSFPPLLIALIALYVLGGSVATLIVTLSLIRWAMFARSARALALGLTAKEFIEAAQAYGASTPRLVFLHLWPNAARPLASIATLEIARVILLEASLSFLGLGVQPPATSWGAMIADEREFLVQAWWVGLFPGLAILVTAFSMNIISSFGTKDSVR